MSGNSRSPSVDRPRGDVPEILLIAGSWRFRTLLRAQLIEEGYDVFAVETWSEAIPLLRGELKPLVAVADLEAATAPESTLAALRMTMRPERVIVVTATGALPVDAVRARGFPHVLARPISIGDITAAVRHIMARAHDSPRVCE